MQHPTPPPAGRRWRLPLALWPPLRWPLTPAARVLSAAVELTCGKDLVRVSFHSPTVA